MPHDMDRAPYRVQLNKSPGVFFVIADDEGVYSADSWLPNWTPQRDVLEVQRAADNEIERALQREDLTETCFDSQSPLQFLTYEAVSCAHAAHLARRDFALQRDFQDLADVFYADEIAFDGAGFTHSDH